MCYRWLAVGLMAAGLMAGMWPQAARAEIVYRGRDKAGRHHWAVGVRTDRFNYYVAKQKKTNWCWAATIQMVIGFHGIRVGQEQIVRYVKGHLANQRAVGPEILKGLNFVFTDNTGRKFRGWTSEYIRTDKELIDDLGYRWPLIVGLRNPTLGGHAYVLTGVYFYGHWTRPRIYAVVLRDPWPTNPSRLVMRWDHFRRRLMFYARIRVKRVK